MKPVATPSGQLTSQEHRAFLAPPYSENPGCLVLSDNGKTPSASMFVTTDAQLVTDPICPSCPQEAAYPVSSVVKDRPASPISTGIAGGVKLQGLLTQSPSLENLPNEVLFHIMGFLDVNDLLSTSRFLDDWHDLWSRSGYLDVWQLDLRPHP
ncbi:f-box domain-containing protein [Fusarium heterosporum]|uniref:F-box domain-containing protein n=1 Tax=Fusarium heterosporum TaxID=42747 RepID=A0A8H5X296_FUSHE|nr:f-box domain-containing protein [Fusarium heterosporum]